MGITDQFANEAVGGAVDMLRLGEGVRRKILRRLNTLTADLNEQIRIANLAGLQDSVRLKRAEALLKRTDRTIATAYRDMDSTLQSELREVSKVSALQVKSIAEKVFSANILSPSLNVRDLRNVADNTLILGGPAKDWWKGQAQGLQRQFSNTMRTGVLQGRTNQELMRDLRGTVAGRTTVIVDGKRRVISRFTGGLMSGTPTHQINALVRTSVQTVSNRTIMDTYKKNSDIIKHVQALATLDLRTTDICKARAGGTWDINTGAATKDSPINEDFPGPPPWHHNCRTVLVPITKTWDELIKGKRGRTRKRFERIPPSKRATMDGLRAGDLNYEQWLRNQSQPRQIAALGPSKWKLWKDGKITMAQLIDQSGRPLSVRELTRKYGGGGGPKPPPPKPRPKPPPPPKPPPKPPTAEDFRKKAQDQAAAMQDAAAKAADVRRKVQTEVREALRNAGEFQVKGRNEMADIMKRHLDRAEGGAAIKKPRTASARLCKEDAEIAQNWHTNVVSKKTGGNDFAYTVVRKRRGTRAFAGLNQGTVSLTHLDGVETHVHEIAHLIESRNPKVLKAATDFVKRRGGDLRKLRDLTGSKGYGIKELALEDEFYNAYVGKVYVNPTHIVTRVSDGTKFLSSAATPTATEVVSMGLDAMYKNPGKFLIQDEEHFNLILDIMMGGI
jgi:SPP1 gp7 family putative phage head morphogenesis protein